MSHDWIQSQFLLLECSSANEMSRIIVHLSGVSVRGARVFPCAVSGVSVTSRSHLRCVRLRWEAGSWSVCLLTCSESPPPPKTKYQSHSAWPPPPERDVEWRFSGSMYTGGMLMHERGGWGVRVKTNQMCQRNATITLFSHEMLQ